MNDYVMNSMWIKPRLGLNNGFDRAYSINNKNVGVFDKDYMFEEEYDDYVSDHCGSLAEKTFMFL